MSTFQFICSATVRKEFALEVSEPVSQPNWLDTWRIESLKERSRHYRLFITNEATFYSYLIPHHYGRSFPQLLDFFTKRLQETCARYDRADEDFSKRPHRFVSGNPRSLIGFMNNAISRLSLRESVHFEDLEHWQNEVPVNMCGFQTPAALFAQRLGQSESTKTGTSD